MTFLRRALLTPLAILVLVAAPVRAQVGGPPMGPPGGGWGPGLVALLLDARVHAALGLAAAQETQWTALQTADQALRTSLQTAHTALQSQIDAQFATGSPDLVAIDNAVAAAHATGQGQMDAVRTQAVAFYQALNTGQQGIVMNAAIARYQQRQAFAAHRALGG